MSLKPSLIALALALGLQACTSLPEGSAGRDNLVAEASGISLSPAALSTAVVDASGKRAVYAAPLDALQAGDTAGYLTLLAAMPEAEREEDRFLNAYLALDRAAAGDMAGARNYLGITGDAAADFDQPGFYLWIDAWLMALEGNLEGAINRHREVAGGMP
ncbi:MAG: hypothetical protein MUE84_04665, partial [Hyphomonas sp.]|nr:hypothetical protein [Hyphomonas sp.]